MMNNIKNIFLIIFALTSFELAYAVDFDKIDAGDIYTYEASIFSEPERVTVIQKYNDGNVKVRRENGDTAIIPSKKLGAGESEFNLDNIANGIQKLYELDISQVTIQLNNQCNSNVEFFVVFHPINNSSEEESVSFKIDKKTNAGFLKYEGTSSFINPKYPYYIAAYNKGDGSYFNFQGNDSITRTLNDRTMTLKKHNSGDADYTLCR